MMRILILCFQFLIFVSSLHAQHVSVQSDRYRIRLGESFSLTLKAVIEDGQRVVWPVMPDSIGPHFDILQKGPVDTLPDEARKGMELLQKIEATSFDSGMHTMPVFAFDIISANGDTAHIITDPLTFQVLTVPVDTTKAIKDIHGVVDVPFDIGEYIPWILVGLVIAALLVAGIYLWLKRKRPEAPAAPVAPSIPAWERALIALEEIGKEKVWQSGRDKIYHSAITDTLRIYLEEQFKLPALESTTDETMNMVRKVLSDKDVNESLRQILVLADLVKFAKEKPLPAEHDRSLELAKNFVELTRPRALEQPAKGKEESHG
jgi:hypothetical protein